MAKALKATAPSKTSFAADKVERRKLSDLKPYPRNPRTHSTDQVEALVSMIKEFGFTQPLIVDEKNVILAGHGRLQAAQKLAFDELPVIILRGLSADQKRAIVIADNQSSDMSGWDKDLLKLELGELKLSSYDLSLTGFDEASLVSYMTTTSVESPGSFQTFDETIDTQHQCPKCRYKWSGNSAAPVEK